MGRQGARLTQVDRKHVNGKENRLLVYTKHYVVQYTMHLDWWDKLSELWLLSLLSWPGSGRPGGCIHARARMMYDANPHVQSTYVHNSCGNYVYHCRHCECPLSHLPSSPPEISPFFNLAAGASAWCTEAERYCITVQLTLQYSTFNDS